MDDLQLQIAAMDWSPMLMSMSTDVKWQLFKQLFIFQLDRVAPLRSVPARKPVVLPLTYSTRQIIQQRQTALVRGSRPNYKQLNRQCKSAIRRDSQNYFQREILRHGRSKFWKIIKPVLGKKQTDSSPLDMTPEALNNYYVSVGPYYM